MDIPFETKRQSYAAVRPEKTQRQHVILEILEEYGEMTAQEVATQLHRRGFAFSDDRNVAAPRLTELRDAGKIVAVRKKRCEKTGRNVTVWSIRKEHETCHM